VNNFIFDSIFSGFAFYYKNVILGCYVYSHKDDNAFFLMNLILLLAKFHIHKCKQLI